MARSMVSRVTAWASGELAMAMNFRAASLLGVPLGMTQ